MKGQGLGVFKQGFRMQGNSITKLYTWETAKPKFVLDFFSNWRVFDVQYYMLQVYNMASHKFKGYTLLLSSTQLPSKLHKMQSWPWYSPT